jgi:hypothetical protein
MMVHYSKQLSDIPNMDFGLDPCALIRLSPAPVHVLNCPCRLLVGITGVWVAVGYAMAAFFSPIETVQWHLPLALGVV